MRIGMSTYLRMKVAEAQQAHKQIGDELVRAKSVVDSVMEDNTTLDGLMRDALVMLRALEHEKQSDGRLICPMCGGVQPDHAQYCVLNRLLTRMSMYFKEREARRLSHPLRPMQNT